MRGLLILAALGAGAYWAYRAGHLDEFLDRFRGSDGLIWGIDLDGISADLDTVSPVLAANAAGVTRSELSKEEQILWDHADELSGWSEQNFTWTAAMMWAESRGRANARSPAGALGLMQVMPGTAADLYKWGWTRHRPDADNLMKPAVSVYFGTAYLEYLSRKDSDREWITRAYNAGPGGKRSDGTWPAETVKYLAAVKGRYDEIINRKAVA